MKPRDNSGRFAQGFHAFQPPLSHGQGSIFPDLPTLFKAAATSFPAVLKEIPSSCDILTSDAVFAARGELFRVAKEFTENVGLAWPQHLPSTLVERMGIIATGHQPEFIHPGVWYKDFVVHHVAKRTDGMAVHLITDNDLVRRSSIRVPHLDRLGEVSIQELRWDDWPGELSYEVYNLRNKELGGTFDKRILRALGSLISQPLITEFWPRVVERYQRGIGIGHAIAATLIDIGNRSGLATVAVPMGLLCDQHSFLRFVGHILRDAYRFRQIHNAQLEAYRHLYRVRSQTHPVPQLRSDDGWTEVPFWIWSDLDPRRRPMFIATDSAAAIRGGGIGGDRGWDIPIEERWSQSPESALSALLDLQERRIRIRPRAVTTTMYARLYLCDLFVHGVGGAKYDIFTDTLIRLFFGVQPPIYAAATATFRLPLGTEEVTTESIRDHRQKLRDLVFHPETIVAKNPQKYSAGVLDLCRKKRELVQECPPRGTRKNWHLAVVDVNKQLGVQLASEREGLLKDWETLWNHLMRSKALRSREFAAVLFPSAELIEMLLDISQNPA